MIGPILALVAGYVLTGDPLGSLAVLVLYICWRLLRGIPGPPVLFLALAYHWLQGTLGLFYMHLTGRELMAPNAAEWRTMVVMALGCVLMLGLGIRLGYAYTQRSWPDRSITEEVFSFKTLLAAYFAAFFVTGLLQSIAWNYPLFTQPMIASTAIRLGLFYFAVRRLLLPEVQPVPLIALLGFEIAIGVSGFFASFREPLLLAGIAFVEAFDRRRVSHWFGMAALVVLAGSAGLFWMGVRGEYREDYANVELFETSRSMRLERLRQLGRDWSGQDMRQLQGTVDFLVDRVWAIYFPALAVARVPAVVPHANGEIMWTALLHITAPRVLFPNKPALISDSDLVRKYSGVRVAGAETNTSIAFGYAAEAYVDFGMPMMFLPVLLWGGFMGMAYQLLRYFIRHEELVVPLLVVVFWMALSQFERSWAKTMGLTGTLIIYLGGFTYLVDRWLMQRYVSRREGVVSLPPAMAPTHPTR